MEPDNTMAPLEEEEEERRRAPAIRFDIPTLESETPLNPDAEVETSVTQLEDLTNMRVAVLVFADVEEAEIIDTTKALREAGAQVDVISPDGHEVQLMRHDERTRCLPANSSYNLASAADYDATLLPGGTINADNLRMQEQARTFVRDLDAAGKPIAAICHAPWLL